MTVAVMGALGGAFAFAAKANILGFASECLGDSFRKPECGRETPTGSLARENRGPHFLRLRKSPSHAKMLRRLI